MTIPATQLSQNQFAQTPIQGEVDLRFSPTIVSAQIDVSSAGSLIPGQAMKRVDSAGGVPKIVEIAAASEKVFCFLPYDIKRQVFSAGDAVDVLIGHDGVMYMIADEAISADADVSVVVGSVRVHNAVGGERIIGRSYDKATAAGQLIRVMVELPGALA